MIASTETEPSGLTDPRYAEGLHHLQRGEWQQAIDDFEALIATYGASGPIQEALDEARFKAGRDAKARIRARRWIIPWRMILTRAAIVITLGVAVFGGVQFINRRIAPMVAQSQEQRKPMPVSGHRPRPIWMRTNLDRAEADVQCASWLGYRMTRRRARRWRRSPDRRQLLAKYDRAVALQAAGRHEEALKLFTDISLLAPATRDVRQRIATISKQLELDRLFAEGGSGPPGRSASRRRGQV